MADSVDYHFDLTIDTGLGDAFVRFLISSFSYIYSFFPSYIFFPLIYILRNVIKFTVNIILLSTKLLISPLYTHLYFHNVMKFTAN